MKHNESHYQILDHNGEFAFEGDPMYLFEFYPGDIVEVEIHNFKDGSSGLVAKKLIKLGQWSDRKFNEFKFRATQGAIPLNKISAEFYTEEIERIIREQESGEEFYQDTLDTVKKL